MKKLFLLIGILIAFVSISIAADSELVKAAKKEKERRSKVEAKKTLTNQDIDEIRKKQLGIETAAAPGGEPAEETDKEDKKVKKEVDPTQTEQYWRERKQETDQRVEEAQSKVQQLQNEINNLTTAFYAESDGVAQRPLIESERIERIKELEQAKQDLENARTEAANLEDEARKAGALPGWVRD
jgi:DNA repair exonuclease SbcCD ATPase subunit